VPHRAGGPSADLPVAVRQGPQVVAYLPPLVRSGHRDRERKASVPVAVSTSSSSMGSRPLLLVQLDSRAVGPALSLLPQGSSAQPGGALEAGLVSTAGGLDNPVMSDDAVNQELRSAIAARKELGDEMEPAVIDAFVERIERRLADGAGERELALMRRRDHQKEMVLGSMAISIPLLAIAAIFTGLQGVIVVCVALVVIAIITAR
jgi:hypothetical protein